MMHCDSRAYSLFSLFTRTLAHQLRTPLSVVVNDLTYYQTQLQTSECERGLRRCRDINSVLSEMLGLVGPQLSRVNVRAQDLLQALQPVRLEPGCPALRESAVLPADCAALARCANVLRGISQSRGVEGSAEILIFHDENYLVLRFAGLVSEKSDSFSAAGILELVELGALQPLPVMALIDIIFSAHAANISIEREFCPYNLAIHLPMAKPL